MHRFGLCLRIALMGVTLAGLSACSTTPTTEVPRPVVQQAPNVKDGAAPVASAPSPAANSSPLARDATPAVTTTVAELQSLIKDHQVNELRTTYNGSYGASLLFEPGNLTYYVALFQQRDFWQVTKTTSAQQADSIYQIFAKRTAELAQVDFERIRLQAENAKAEQQLNTRMARLSTLQADQALREQQSRQVATRQAELSAEARSLSKQQQDIYAQLRDMQRQIAVLQAENNSLSTVNRALAAAKHSNLAKKPAKKSYSRKKINRRTSATTP